MANARKRSERCVACVGARTGRWVRLVSRAEHGELSYAQRNLGEGGEPQKLDLIRVHLSTPKPQPGQPENWLVANEPWQLIKRPAGAETLGILRHAVCGESLLFGSACDRIAAADFAGNAASASLALVIPSGVRWLKETLGSKIRARVLFQLGEVRYNLSLTDPPVEERLKSLADGQHTSAELGLAGDRLAFCISLGETFMDGNCYKLVAGVIEIPGG